MNTRSSLDRQDSTKYTRRLTAASTTPVSRPADRLKKRQHFKPSVARHLTSRKSLLNTLSQAEQDSLLRRQALIEAGQGHYDDAIKILTHLIDRNPTSATGYNNRGLVYFQSGQSEAAIADYNMALKLNPRLDSAYNNRANYYAAQGELIEAVADYDVAIDLNPGNVRAWINQSITFRELRLYDEAIDNFDIALCLGGLEGHIYAERGRTYHLRGDWNCAIADYQRALTHLPQGGLSKTNPSNRLRLKVEGWLNDLLSPLKS